MTFSALLVALSEIRSNCRMIKCHCINGPTFWDSIDLLLKPSLQGYLKTVHFVICRDDGTSKVDIALGKSFQALFEHGVSPLGNLVTTSNKQKPFDVGQTLSRFGKVTTDAGLLAYRELDEALGLTETGGELLADSRLGSNKQHRLVPLLRQSIYSRLAGYEDVNDAERLAIDPAMRYVVGGRAALADKYAASTSEVGRFETDILNTKDTLKKLMDLSGEWIDQVHMRQPPRARSMVRCRASKSASCRWRGNSLPQTRGEAKLRWVPSRKLSGLFDAAGNALPHPPANASLPRTASCRLCRRLVSVG